MVVVVAATESKLEKRSGDGVRLHPLTKGALGGESSFIDRYAC